jgi:cysteine-rich repeat protein
MDERRRGEYTTTETLQLPTRVTRSRSPTRLDASMQQRSRFLVSFTCLLALVACGGGEKADLALCGNGSLDPGEQCDDGNRFDGDNCPSNCQGSFTTFDVATNHCPELIQMSILPSSAPVGSIISLSALAKDADGDKIFYDWTGTGGLLSHESHSKRASYQCGYPGVHALTLWMFDAPGCVTTSQLEVTCR